MRIDEPISQPSGAALVRVRGLSKRVVRRAPLSGKKFTIEALTDVSFEIASACVTALIGHSGSGKSTLAACLAMIEKPDRGEIWFEGREITGASGRQLASLRPSIQIVFQDSAGALNPRLSAAQIVAEPLEIQRHLSRSELREHVYRLMEEVSLSPDSAERKPLEFSGGQRQRLAIARALALNPRLLILDESLSGLDLSTQAQILNMLLDLQCARSLTTLLVSHDLNLVGQVTDFVLVMHQGRIVEKGSTQSVLRNPRHPHTCELLASVHSFREAYRTASVGGRL